MLLAAHHVAVNIDIRIHVQRSNGLDGVQRVVQRTVVPKADVEQRLGIEL